MGEKGNYEIVLISNQYEDLLNAFIDSSDPKSLDWAKPINNRFCNAFKSEGSLTYLSKSDYLDENVLDKSSRLVLNTKDLKCINIVLLYLEQVMGRIKGGEKTIGKIR